MAATNTMTALTSFGVAAPGVAAGRATARFPVGVAPRGRAMQLVVRAQDKPDVDPTVEETTTSTTTSPSSPTPSSTSTAAPSSSAKPKAAKPSANLVDVMAFGGPAPERINGRLAMVGFVSALAVEASRGDGILSQAGSGAGLSWFVATAAVLSAASLVPLLKGESAEARSGAIMSANAELWNGRFAMLGLVALAFTEFVTGMPFVNV